MSKVVSPRAGLRRGVLKDITQAKLRIAFMRDKWLVTSTIPWEDWRERRVDEYPENRAADWIELAGSARAVAKIFTEMAERAEAHAKVVEKDA